MLQLSINKHIVEVIIRYILINPDEIEGVTRASALYLFKIVEHDPVDNVNEDVPESSDLIAREEYVAIIKTAKSFHLLVDNNIIVASFRLGSQCSLNTCTIRNQMRKRHQY